MSDHKNCQVQHDLHPNNAQNRPKPPKTSKSPRFSDFVTGLTEGSRTKGQGSRAKACGPAELFPHSRSLALAFRAATTVAAWTMGADGCWMLLWNDDHIH